MVLFSRSSREWEGERRLRFLDLIELKILLDQIENCMNEIGWMDMLQSELKGEDKKFTLKCTSNRMIWVFINISFVQQNKLNELSQFPCKNRTSQIVYQTTPTICMFAFEKINKNPWTEFSIKHTIALRGLERIKRNRF